MLLLVAILIATVAWLLEGTADVPWDAIVISLVVVANAFLGVWQERRAESAVAALQRMTTTHTRVMRGGHSLSVPSDELVPGDLVVLEEGDAVAADIRLTDVSSLRIAEAALTGESHPVAKQILPVGDVGIGDRTNMAFSGTAVVSGNGRGVVTATGMRAEVGTIAQLLEVAAPQPSPLQRELARVGKGIGLAVVGVAVLVVAAILIVSGISTASDVVDGLLIGVSLAVAAVPEGLPAILTVVLAMGVQRMSANHALVKQLSSVETLGSTSVICTDKTGTLTRNEMTVTRVVTATGAAPGCIGPGPAPALSASGSRDGSCWSRC